MYRFMLTFNPLRPDKVYITHTIKPKCIIQVIKSADISLDEYSNLFDHNQDSNKAKYTLVTKEIFSETTSEEIQKTLSRAWRWYRSFLLDDKTQPIKHYINEV